MDSVYTDSVYTDSVYMMSDVWSEGAESQTDWLTNRLID